MIVNSKRILKRVLKVNAAKQAYRHEVALVQKICKHKHIYEYRSYPPIRVCADCGIQEEGWGIGHKVLHLGDMEYRLHPATIDLDELCEIRHGLLIDEELKGRLSGNIYNKPVPLGILIDEWEQSYGTR